MIKALRIVLLSITAIIACLIAPVGYIEMACRPDLQDNSYVSLLPPEDHRAEGRTLLTYPEWHIVHAYEEYARVISDRDPHDFRYASSIAGFWTSLCSLSKASGDHGGFPSEFKQTIYTIGVSFTLELAGKALYEETIGRASTIIRGSQRSDLDDLTARQAKEYSHFLRQVPWYKWDFTKDASVIAASGSGSFRDVERRFSIGAEYSAKAAYAKVIEKAVANMEPDALRLRLILKGMEPGDLDGYEGVSVVSSESYGMVIETPRYRELTGILFDMALNGADFLEIAGNDDILVSLTSDLKTYSGAIYSFERQGFGDTRHLVLLPVADLAGLLRETSSTDLTLEHIHDY